MFGFNQMNGYKGLVMFCRKAPENGFGFSTSKQKKLDESNPQILFLLSKYCDFPFFDIMPKNFAISTKNSKCFFNLDMLKEVSPVIAQFVNDSPTEMHFPLNISDEENALAKFEKLFKGETVFFDEDEIPSSQRITKMLKIKNCPNYLKPESLKINEIDTNGNSCAFTFDSKSGVSLHIKNFLEFMKEEKFQAFKIKTNKKEYKCNIFSVYTSNVIRQILEKDPTISEYEYNFEDEYDEFQSICDFLNFKQVDITKNNMDSIMEIIEDLQINCIKKQVDDFINNYEKFTQKVDEQQTIIDSIDNLFDLLYNIKKIGIEKVKNSLLESKWVESEDNIQELAAFIIQVVKPDFSLHQEIADLLIQLNEEASSTSSKLKILLPFIVQKLLTVYMPYNNNSIDAFKSTGATSTTAFTGKMSFGSFGSFGSNNNNNNGMLSEPILTNDLNDLNSRCVFAFIRILYNKGIITKEQILLKLKNYNFLNKSLNAFFLPELIEMNPKNIESIFFANSGFADFNGGMSKKNDSFSFYASKYLPDKIDLYKRMLDSMEPEDDLTKSLRHDDVDKLQMIVTRNEIDISKAVVPYNIFDDFEINQTILNYSALYGSLKCFKYLLLNNGQIDDSTLYFAVYGGNIEIIKIVDQSQHNYSNIVNNQSNNNNNQFGFSSSAFSFGSGSTNSTYGFNNCNNMLTKIVSGRSINYVNFTVDNNIISSTIKMHRNELFDWIFEKIFVNNGKIGNNLKDISLLSAANGNAHSLIEIIDKGFDVSANSLIINLAAKNGFCKLTQLLLSMNDQKAKKETVVASNSFGFNSVFDYQSSVYFGNLSIFKLFIKQMDIPKIESAILCAIKLDYTQILIYYFNNPDKSEISQSIPFIKLALTISLKKKTDELFNFLFEKFKSLQPCLFDMQLYSTLLNNACTHSNLPATKTLTEIILDKDPKFNFSAAFINASSSCSMNICQYFIDKKVPINYEQLSSKVSEFGSIDEELFVMIINNVSPSTKRKFLKCIDQAIAKKNKKLIEFLLKENAPIETALFVAVYTHDLEIVNLILNYNSKPSYINKKNNDGTVLHVACKNKDLDIVKRLLSIPGIDPSLYNHQNESCVNMALKSNDMNIIDAVLNFYGDDITSKPWIVSDCLRYLIRNVNNAKETWQIVQRFFEIKSINPNYYDQDTFLCRACAMNKIDVVKSLLALENIDVNMYESRNYNTPLLISIENNYLEIAKLLINFPKTDINIRNGNNESALNIAVRKNQKQIVDLLIKSERFDLIESRLDFAFFNANSEISMQLSTLSFLDINQAFDVTVQAHGMGGSSTKTVEKTALTKAVEINDVAKIDIIINHPSFNKEKSEIRRAIFFAARENNIDIFIKLINLADFNINIKSRYDKSLLEVASIHMSGDIVDYILNNPQFDSQSSHIFDAFVSSLSQPHLTQNQQPILNVVPQAFGAQQQQQPPLFQPQILNQRLIPDKSSVIEIITKLLNYDKEHDHLIKFDSLLQNGKSLFTSILNNYNEISLVSDFLIENGVDSNAADKSGVYPLQHAISLNSFDFVSSLIRSNKIELCKVLGNGQTYLHFAASCRDNKILRLILSKNVIDINAENDYGDTPLIEACKAKIINNINLLFEDNNLDYLHCNKYGKDALKSVRALSESDELDAKQSKESYHQKLIAICS